MKIKAFLLSAAALAMFAFPNTAYAEKVTTTKTVTFTTEINNGGEEYIIDVTDADGIRIRCDFSENWGGIAVRYYNRLLDYTSIECSDENPEEIYIDCDDIGFSDDRKMVCLQCWWMPKDCTLRATYVIEKEEFDVDEYGVLRKYNGSESVVVIPDNVKAIGEGVFAGNKSLTKVVIPEGVTSIDKEAFDDCMHLKTVEIPASVENIEKNAFRGTMWLMNQWSKSEFVIVNGMLIDAYGCSGAVTVPKEARRVYLDAFVGNDSITSLSFATGVQEIISTDAEMIPSVEKLTIPSTVNTFYNWYGYVYFDCLACFPNLKSITVSANNKTFDSRNNCNAIIETATNTLIKGCQTTVIPDDVVTIGHTAFAYNKGMGKVVIPDNVTHVKTAAFCSSDITEIAFPKTCKVEYFAVGNCDKLESIWLSEETTQWTGYGWGIDIPNTIRYIYYPGAEREAWEASRMYGQSFHKYFPKATIQCGVGSVSWVERRVDGMEVKWGAIEGATEYIVYRKDSPEQTSWKAIGRTTETSFYDKTAPEMTKLIYTVKPMANGKALAYDKVGFSKDNGLFYVRTPELSMVNTPTGIKISWEFPEPQPYDYWFQGKLLRLCVSDGEWIIISDDLNHKGSYLDTDVEEGVTYYYGIALIDPWADDFESRDAQPFIRTSFPFTDVKRGGWQETAAKYMFDNGLMSGKTATTFDPNTPMNRGQLVTVLWNMAGKPKVSGSLSFPDVSTTSSFYKAILWASQNKIISGYANGNFGPKDDLTRQQIAAILMNYAKYCGISITNKADLSAYKDASQVSKTMTTAMQWAVGNKLISGKSSGTLLDPKGQATRIEVAAMVMNYCKKFR